MYLLYFSWICINILYLLKYKKLSLFYNLINSISRPAKLTNMATMAGVIVASPHRLSISRSCSHFLYRPLFLDVSSLPDAQCNDSSVLGLPLVSHRGPLLLITEPGSNTLSLMGPWLRGGVSRGVQFTVMVACPLVSNVLKWLLLQFDIVSIYRSRIFQELDNSQWPKKSAICHSENGSLKEDEG